MFVNRFVRQCMLALCLLLCLCLCSCARNPSEEKLYAKVLARFEEAGYSAKLMPVPDGQPVGLADASCWQQIQFQESETPVLIYFDESNRADYLKTFVDAEAFGLVTRFGQRFVLTYNGADEKVISLLMAMD